MCPTEEDDDLLHRSRGIELLESEVEAESVIESVVRGEKIESGGGDAHWNEVDESRAGDSNISGFGEKDTSDDPVGEDIEKCVETGSYHSATSDDRYDRNYLANKRGNLFLEINR